MSRMNPARRSLLRDRLAGIEFRNQLRQARRRSILQASLERQREGTARPYVIEYATARTSPLSLASDLHSNSKGGEV